MIRPWDVPVPLPLILSGAKILKENADPIVAWIDGVRCVDEISKLAAADLVKVKECLEHLFCQKLIGLTDIFHTSNSYTLTSSIQWLAEDSHVQNECGPFVTLPNHPIPPWPTLLRLYTLFQLGLTIVEWMKLSDVSAHSKGLDVRRLCMFGVVKGFLRRVYAYPCFVSVSNSGATNTTEEVAKGRLGSTAPLPTSMDRPRHDSSSYKLGSSEPAEVERSNESESSNPTHRRHILDQKSEYPSEDGVLPVASATSSDNPTTATPTSAQPMASTSRIKLGAHSSALPPILSQIVPLAPPLSTSPPHSISSYSESTSSSPITFAPPSNSSTPPPNLPSELPLPPLSSQEEVTVNHTPPLEKLKDLLDGTHHTDELSVMFRCEVGVVDGWFGDVERWEDGKVVVVYR